MAEEEFFHAHARAASCTQPPATHATSAAAMPPARHAPFACSGAPRAPPRRAARHAAVARRHRHQSFCRCFVCQVLQVVLWREKRVVSNRRCPYAYNAKRNGPPQPLLNRTKETPPRCRAVKCCRRSEAKCYARLNGGMQPLCAARIVARARSCRVRAVRPNAAAARNVRAACFLYVLL